MAIILLADDDPLLRRIYKEFLLDEGHEVILCADGQEALDSCSRKMPDMLILDIHMPNVDGLSACERIRAMPGGNKIPVIIVSGDASPDQLLHCLSHGADLFLSKPVKENQLIQNIAALLKIPRKNAEDLS